MNERQERLRAMAAGAQNRVSSKLGDIWWAFMMRGIFAGVLGLIALIWPTTSLTILIQLVGAYLLVDGMVGLVGAWRASEQGLALWRALVSLVIGLVLLIWPEPFIRILLMVFGAWALYTGISQIFEARRMDPQVTDRGFMTTIGILVAVIGVVLLIWPGSGVVTISWVIAFAALLVGALFIFLALRLKKLKGRVDGIEIPRSGS
jgi:uncharacterized membrane protein HdeD (DUF308 family)